MIRRARRLKLWGGLSLGLLLLFLVAYFLLSSQAFIKGFVLPRVAAAFNARVQVGEVSLSPFSRLQLRQLRVETTGDVPLFLAQEITVRYRLFSLLRGQMVFPEITLVQPELTLAVNPQGESNLDPVLEKWEPSPEPLQLDLGRLSIRSGSLHYRHEAADGSRLSSTVSQLDLEVANLRNDAAGSLKLSAGVLQSSALADGSVDAARGRLTGALDFTMLPSLLPKAASGEIRLEFTEAEGDLQDLAGWSGLLTADVADDEVRQLSVRFQRQGQSLGEARLFGPFSLARQSGRLNLRLSSIGHTALNLIGAPWGLDFGNTDLEGTGFCDIAAGSQTYTVNLALAARNLSLRRGALATPVLDLQLDLRGNADLTAGTAYVEKLVLSGRRGDEELLSLSNQRALNLAWGRQAARSTSPAEISFALRDLRLAEWRALVGTNIHDGVVNLQARLLSAEDGRRLTADFTNQVHQLALDLEGSRWSDLGAVLSGTVTVSEFRNASFERGQFTYLEGPAELIKAQLSATYDLPTDAGNVQVSADADLPVLLARHPVPNLRFERGDLRLTTLFNWANEKYSGTATLLLGDAAGMVGGFRVSGYSAQFDLSGDLLRDKFWVRRIGLSAREGTRSGGTAEVVGHLDGASQTAQFTLNLSGLNQASLRPLLAPTWTTHDLLSVAINAEGDLRYDAGTMAPVTLDNNARLKTVLDQLVAGVGTTTLNLRAAATNLVVRPHTTQQTNAPVGFGVTFAGTRRGTSFEITTNRIQLPATLRSHNELRLTGQLDLAATNATPSTLQVRADSLDLDPLSDLLAAVGTGPTPPATAASAPESEPPALALPLRQFTGDLKIGTLYWREVEVSDWTARAVLENDQLTVTPFSLLLNNAPVSASARLDFTRPGYAYDFGLEASQVPIEPLVNSTAPDYRGQIRGEAFGKLQLAGAGITGPSLQEHLRGEVRLNSTNLHFQIVTPRTKRLLTVLATALRLQELATSPLTLLAADLRIGDGQIQVQPFLAASAAFFASSAGAIRLAPVLTNSTLELPVELALRDDLARQIKLVNLAPSSRTNYLALPPLVRLAGTLGSPETQIDKLRLAAVLAGSVGGAVGGQAGSALQGVGSLLQGNPQEALSSLSSLIPGQAPTPTNTNRTSLIPGLSSGALTNLPSLLPGLAPTTVTNIPPPTNAPATNAPAKPAIQGLLDALRKPN